MKQLTIFFFLVLSFTFFSVELKAQNDGEVIIYKGAKYEDTKKVLTLNGKDRKEYPRLSTAFSGEDWNDNISSIKVGKGVRVRAYIDKGFKGNAFDLFPGSYPKLCSSFADEISALELIKIDKDEPVITVWMDKDKDAFDYRQYIGFGKTTEEGMSNWNQNLSTDETKEENYMGLMCANDAQYIEVPEGLAVVICEDAYLDGDCHEFTGPENVILASWDLEEEVSSIGIKRIGYEVYKIEMIDETIIDKDEEKDLEVGTSSTSVNNTSVAQKTELDIETSWSKSIEWQFSSSTSINMTRSAELSILIASAAAENSIEETVTFGRNSTETKTESRTMKQPVNVPPGKIIKATAYMKPVKIVQKLKLYMRPTQGEGKKEKVDDATRIIETAYKAYFDFNEVGYQGSQDNPVGGSPNTTTSNTTPSSTPSTNIPSSNTPTGNPKWIKMTGKAKSIRAGGDGRVFIVGTDNKLYEWNYSNGTWINTGKRDLQDYAIASDNSIWTIEDGSIYRFGVPIKGGSGSGENIIFEGLIQSYPVVGNKSLGYFGKQNNGDHVYALKKDEEDKNLGKITKIQMIQLDGDLKTIALRVPELGKNTFVTVRGDKRVHFDNAGSGGVPEEAKFRITDPFMSEGPAADNYLSFESVKYPGHFIRHYGWVLRVSPPDGGAFEKDASWLVK